MSQDQETADKFANSWNNVYDASVYTKEQAVDWFEPWHCDDLNGQTVLELGCGSGALLHRLSELAPEAKLTGVDLGESVKRARDLLGFRAKIEKGDITERDNLKDRFGQFDRVYSIGVLHHLKEPEKGVETLIEMTRPGGHFHGWVYAHEGNGLVRHIVDPIRKIVNHFPWWLNKYGVALPLTLPFFLYSNLCKLLHGIAGKKIPLPLFDYMLWISKRDFSFHHHVAFDQLVTPTTWYISRKRVEEWLKHPDIEPGSEYIIFRNKNGWKFGGRKKHNSE